MNKMEEEERKRGGGGGGGGGGGEGGKEEEEEGEEEEEKEEEEEEEKEEEKEEEEGTVDSCELAPHSAMSVGAGRVDSPSPQDIRLLHDLVEDLSKEQDEKNKPRAEQVSHSLSYVKSERYIRGIGMRTGRQPCHNVYYRNSITL